MHPYLSSVRQAQLFPLPVPEVVHVHMQNPEVLGHFFFGRDYIGFFDLA
jgi:hypothetical protein